jgi:hypothetical protein
MKINPVILSMVSAAVVFFGPAALPVSAQVAVPPPTPAYEPLSDQQLDQLLGPIALYPDPLLAEIFPAATLPAEIVLADRYLASGGDPNLSNQQPWDPSVQALTHYATVLQYLDDNLAWTTELGQAFLNQQPQVMDSIQRLRVSAQNYGNLVSTPQEQVDMDNGDIEILPVDPNVIYVPVYQPDLVYYQAGCPLSFGVSFAIGSWLDCDFDWHQHHLFFWDRNHPRPVGWWHERPDQRTAWLAHSGTLWRPQDHRGFRAAPVGDRGYSPAPQPRNNSVVWMSHPGASPRPAAEPRPAAGRPSGEIHVATPAGGGGAFVGGESAHEAREASSRGQESMQAVQHSEPVRSEPSHSEPVRSAPANEGGGTHGSGSQPRR